MWKLKIASVAWPAFMAACILELVVFAFVDPHDLGRAGQALPWSRQAVYTVSFFVFWAVAMVSSALTAVLGTTAPPRRGTQDTDAMEDS
jgi:hypothetical protein